MENKINKSLQVPGVVRAVGDDDSRTVEFVISTESVDRHGTVILSSGWNLDQYRKNPVVAYQHETNGAWGESTNPDSIIGTSEVRVEANQLIGTVTFEPEEINPLAEKILRKIKHGTLRAASVGMLPTAGHWGDESKMEDPDVFYFSAQNLLEWSIVNIPSNPDAIKRNYSEFIETFNKPVIQKSNQRGYSHFEAQIQISKNKA